MMPFPGGIESTENGTLLLSVASAVLYLFAVDGAASWRRTLVKALPVALLAVLAFSTGAPLLLVLALLLSAAGDASLSREGDRAFLAGLSSFLAAHIAYIALFLSHDRGWIAPLVSGALLLTVAFFMTVTTVATLNILLRKVPAGLRFPILAYGAAILLMGLASLTTGLVWIVTGAILFMASDTVLALERFVMSSLGRGRWAARHAVWVLYYAAQLLLTLSVIFAG
ncbi:MAG: lysoplasmalogenase [Rhizobiaceae bacterium]|nr:lysoplasmalogenase [Rhizobiaceae bacterium]